MHSEYHLVCTLGVGRLEKAGGARSVGLFVRTTVLCQPKLQRYTRRSFITNFQGPSRRRTSSIWPKERHFAAVPANIEQRMTLQSYCIVLCCIVLTHLLSSGKTDDERERRQHPLCRETLAAKQRVSTTQRNHGSSGTMVSLEPLSGRVIRLLRMMIIPLFMFSPKVLLPRLIVTQQQVFSVVDARFSCNKITENCRCCTKSLILWRGTEGL